MAQIAFTVKTGVEKGTATFSVDSTESYVSSGSGDSDLFDIGCEGKSITVNGVDPVIGTVTLANSTVYVDKSKVYSDDPGETEITGGTVQATAYKKNHSTEAFTSGDVAWSVSPADKGVTINASTGVITVAPTATAQNFTITAGAVNDKSSADTSPSTATLTVAYTNPTPTSIVVSGGVTAMSVEENESVAETAFSAVVKDQWGEDMNDESVTWSISPTGQGVTIDANGKVHVAPTATVNGTTGKDFTVTATSVTEDSVTANAGSQVHISSLAPWTFTGSYATGNAGTTITYGDAAPTLTTSVSDSETPTYSYSSSNTDVATIDSNGAITIVGAGTATLTVTAAYSAGEHAATQGTHVLTVSKKALTVTAKNHSIVYGDAPANDGVTITGFVNDESQSDLGGTLAFAYTYEQYGDVGDSYKITPSGLTSDNYEITFKQGTLTVAKKEVGLTWSSTPLTYKGEAQAPTATATGLVNNDAIGVTVTGEQTNAGDYTAAASALTGTKASNYKLPTENTKAFTIAPMNITPVVVLSAESGNYTGDSQKPTVTVYTDDTKATALALTTDYTLAWTPNDSVTDVGTYTVTATGVNSGSNYKFTTATATFTMDKAAPTVTAPTAATLTYTGEEQALLNEGTVTGGTLKYSSDGTTWTETVGEITGKDAKTYTVYYKVVGDDNHSDVDSTPITVKINPKAISGATITLGTQATYDGEQHDVVITSVMDGTTELVAGTDYTITSGGVATNCGNTTLTITGKGNYGKTNTKTWTLLKANPTVTDFNITAPGAVDYTGNAISATAPTVKSGKSGMGTITVKYKKGDDAATTTAPINAGEYAVTFDVNGGDNYNAASGLEIGTLKINKVTPTLTFANSNVTAREGGSAPTNTLTITPSGVTVAYSSSNPSVATVNATTGVLESLAEGTTDITATVTESDNYAGATAKYTLKVLPSGDTTSILYSATGINENYDGSAHKIAVDVEQPAGAKVTYSTTESGPYSDTNPVFTKAGTYKVYYKITADGTSEVTGSATVIINKVAASATAPTAKTLTYTGEAQALVNSGTTNDGTIQYKLDDGSWSTTIPTGTNAGDYAVSYKVVGDENHTDSAEAAISGVKINKANPTIDKTDGKSVEAGKTLDLGTVFNNNVKAPMTYTITNADDTGSTVSGSTLTAGSKAGTVTVQASIAETKNYNAATSASCNVMVTPASTPSGGGGGSSTTPSSTDSTIGGGGGGGYTPRDRDTDSSTTTDKNTTTNADGSITTTVKNSDGSVTETTRATDGSTTTTKTEKTGEATTTEKAADGSTGTTKTDAAGNTVAASATVSQQAVRNAARYGSAVKVPVSVKASNSAASAAAVDIALPETSEPVAVEIPVENVSAGTVAVIVHPDGTEEIVKTSTVGKDGVVLTLDGSAKVKIVDNSKYFADVPSNEWYADNVAWASSREIMNGTGDFAFAPNDPTSRSMVAQLLFNLDGAAAPDEITTLFADVNPSDWYANSVTWAVSSGIARGMGDNLFGANQVVTREQFAVMMYNYAQLKGYDVSTSGNLTSFPDADGVSDWAADAMAWAVGVGLINGTTDADGNTVLNAQGTATRAQVAAIMQRFCEKVAK